MSSTAPDEARRLWTHTKKTLRRSLSSWPIYVVALTLGVVAAYFAPQVIKPVYISEATLVYQELIPASTLMGNNDVVAETPQQRGTRLRELLLSRTHIEEIIRTHDLYPDLRASKGMVQAVNEFIEDVDVRASDDTFTILYRYHDPDQVHDVVAALTSALVDKSEAYRANRATKAVDFLASQRDATKDELAERERDLAEFLARHPEFAHDVGVPGQAAGASIRARDRKQDAAFEPAEDVPLVESLRRQRARIRHRIRSIDNPEEPTTTVVAAAPKPKGEPDPAAMRALERAERDHERALDTLRQKKARFTPAHPDVRRAESALSMAKSSLAQAKKAAEASRAAPAPAPVKVAAPKATEADRAALTARLGALDDKIERAQKGEIDPKEATSVEGDSIVDLETRWAALHRGLRDTQERHNQMEQRYFQANILAQVERNGGSAKMIVVDAPYLPQRPMSRGPRRVGAVAGALAFLLIAAIALARGFLDDRLLDRRDLDHLNLAGFAHTIPKTRAKAPTS